MKKLNIIILFSLLFTKNGISQSKHSVGLDIGLYKKNRKLFYNQHEQFFSPNSVYTGILYSYKLAKKTSISFKAAILSNYDKIVVIDKNDVYYAEPELNYLRFSVLYSQKIGNPNKFYAIVKMGLGRSEFIGGSYSLIPTFGANHGFSFDVDRKDNKMENWDLFSEGGVGFGFKVYKKFDVQITFDYITGLMNFNRNEDYPSVSHDPIPFYSLDEYEINSNYESYVFKTNLYGGNITIMYNF